MDQETLQQFRDRFTIKCYEQTSSSFQTWFAELMSSAFPGDFITIRTGGSSRGGDAGCDGFRQSDNTVFQVYAPRTQSYSQLNRKIRVDFTKAKENFPHMQKWVFVHNDPDGITKDTLDELNQMGGDEIAIEYWSREMLWRQIRELPYRGLADLFGPVVASNFQRSTGRFEGESPSTSHHVNQRQKPLPTDFVVPKFVVSAIENSIDCLGDRGYVHLIAPSGFGKSTVAKALIENSEFDEFNLNAIGWSIGHGRLERTADFLDEVEHQATYFLADKFGGRLRGLPTCISAESELEVSKRLVEIIETVKVQRCPDNPLLLVIDGLDELTDSSGEHTDVPFILDVLPNPASLPSGCYVLLTSRPRNELKKSAHSFVLRHCESEFFVTCDVSDDHQGLQDAISDFFTLSLGEEISESIVELLGLAQNNFFLARLYSDLLKIQFAETGTFDIKNLSNGSSVFSEYFRVKKEAISKYSDGFDRLHRKLLLLVATAFEPVTRRHLKFWLSLEDSTESDHQLNLALEEFSTLVEEFRPHDLPDDSLFRISHRTALTWFKQTSDPEWTNGVAETHLSIATSLAVNKDRLESLHEQRIPMKYNPLAYFVLHLPSHLRITGKHRLALETLVGFRLFGESIVSMLEGNRRMDFGQHEFN